MFAQDHAEYMDKFFAEHHYPSVSWLHDLERGRYGLAASSLLSEADHASELSSKHVMFRFFFLSFCDNPSYSHAAGSQLMLSIGKLSYLAQVQEGDSAFDEQTLDGSSFCMHACMRRPFSSIDLLN